jgi:light-regulated signal transduction histidine kinase (bacteriophytochrome)
LAVASLYALVILYSWLLPGKYASIYAALACTFLTILSAVQSGEMTVDSKDLSHMNIVVSLVVIWICVILVLIAKSGFTSLENSNQRLTDNSSKLLEKVKELDAQQKELSKHKIQLEDLNSELLVKNQELERFTSIASHDLQEPLRTIGNMTYLIHKKYYKNLDDKGKQILEYVASATSRMTNLIKGLLDFSRIGNNRDIQEVDCQELVNTISEDFETALQEVNGTVKFNELPKVMGNPLELRIVFQNLISNGLKFKKQNTPPVIEVSAEESNTHFKFCVTDNGIGIDKSNHDKIFFIFQRLHSLEEFEGTGLGLAYCRKIVELHGGKIWIESKKGVGSSFYFTLEKNT